MHDVIIIGGGPAGMSAALYCARAALKTAVLEKYPVSGGQMNLTDAIENFPAYESAEGMEIAAKLRAQAENAGAEFICRTADRIISDRYKTIETDSGSYICKALIYAAGAQHRKLGVKGEEEFTGRGVSYCAVCDGGFYRKKTAAVIGGGDTALKEALYLAKLCAKVYLIHRREEFRGGKYLLEKCLKQDKIEIIRSAVCTEITGDKTVSGIMLSKDGRSFHLQCDGVFAAVGMSPVTEIMNGICDMNDKGYIIAGEDCKTSADGIFAAGDVRTKPLRQIITACADGANAAYSAEEYLNMTEF